MPFHGSSASPGICGQPTSARTASAAGPGPPRAFANATSNAAATSSRPSSTRTRPTYPPRPVAMKIVPLAKNAGTASAGTLTPAPIREPAAGVASLPARPLATIGDAAVIAGRSSPNFSTSPLSNFAVTPTRNSTPAFTASATSAASNASRDRATPPGSFTRAACRPAAMSASRSGTPVAKTCPSPSSRSVPAAAPLTQHPQTFARGKCALSTSSTEHPRRASSRAATAPAGPAPITTTSKVIPASTRAGSGTGTYSAPSRAGQPGATASERERLLRRERGAHRRGAVEMARPASRVSTWHANQVVQ